MRAFRMMLAACCLLAAFSHAEDGSPTHAEAVEAEAKALIERAFLTYAAATSYRHTCTIELHEADPSDPMLAIQYAVSSGTSTMAWVRPDKLEITDEDTVTRTDGTTFWAYHRAQGEYSEEARLPGAPFLQGLPTVSFKALMGASQVLGMLLAEPEEASPAFDDAAVVLAVRAEPFEGEPGHRVVMGYPGLTIDEAGSSVWFSDRTGLFGEIHVRAAMQQPPPELGAETTEEASTSETPDNTGWPWVALGTEFTIRYRDVELNGEIAPETFVFVPGPGDRLVERLEHQLGLPGPGTPPAVEFTVTLAQGSMEDLGADRLVTQSSRQLGSGIRAHGARVVDLDHDGWPELLLSDRQSELVVVSPDGREVQRVRLQGEGARGTLSDLEPVTLFGNRFWFVAFTEWEGAEPTQVGCALFTAEGEQLWRFAPEVPDGQRPGIEIAVGDLDGDGQPELIAVLTVTTEDWIQSGDMTSRDEHSHVIVFDVTGRRLVQRRLQGDAAQVQVTTQASATDRPKLLLIRPGDTNLTRNVELYQLGSEESVEDDQ